MFTFNSTIIAAPIDLTGFTPEIPDVVETAGTVTFTETMDYASIFFYNDSFVVGDNATILSFNYDLLLGADDYDDYLLFEIDNYASVYNFFEFDPTGPTPAYFEYDISALRGEMIYLSWSLQSEDFEANTVAHVYNIDLTTQETPPVPEPSTFILFGIGILGLARIGRKKLV